MKKLCKVFTDTKNRIVRKLGDINTEGDPYVNVQGSVNTTYLLSIESCVSGEWVFERSEEYSSNKIRIPINSTHSAWLREINMNINVMDGVIKSKDLDFGECISQEEWEKLDHSAILKEFQNTFTNRLSESSNPYFGLDDIDVVKVIASNNNLLEGCLFVEDIPFQTDDIVEIEISDNIITKITRVFK